MINTAYLRPAEQGKNLKAPITPLDKAYRDTRKFMDGLPKTKAKALGEIAETIRQAAIYDAQRTADWSSIEKGRNAAETQARKNLVKARRAEEDALRAHKGILIVACAGVAFAIVASIIGYNVAVGAMNL